MIISRLEVIKNDFVKGNITHNEDELKDGQILIAIDKFAYTSNNTTYAVIGEQLDYWKFFPTANDATGIIPTWGFGEVITSKHHDIPVGKRYFGYYPMASHMVATPGRVSTSGWNDASPHRMDLPYIYNRYNDTSADPAYKPATEDRQLIFRPLFMTSFLIHAMLEQHESYGAQQIILTSASSKTAIALAYCIKAAGSKKINIIGLTSSKNKAFVESIADYDRVMTYDEIESIDNVASVIVDFSGNHNLQADLQSHLGDHLKYNCLVGLVHKEDMKGDKTLTKKGTFFFAPTYMKEATDYMGKEAFRKTSNQLQHQFIDASDTWMKIKHFTGADQLIVLHKKMCAGNIDPSEGYVSSL